MLTNRKPGGVFLDKTLKNKGFTIVELMTTFILVAIISSLLIKLVITLKEVYINGDMKTTLITKQSTMTDKIYKDLKEKELTKIEKCSETNCVNFVYKDTTKKFVINKNKKTVTYDNYTIKLGREGYLGEISLDKYNSDIGFILNFKVPIYNRLVKGNYGINITYQLDNDIEFDNEIVFDVIEKGVTVTFDDNINLLTGLEDKEETTDHNLKYSISNGVITGTGLKGDGWGDTTGRVYLEEGKTYEFSYDTDGDVVYTNSPSVEVWFKLDGAWSAYVHIPYTKKYEFTATKTGEYWLRLDVNGEGVTQKFWNISIKEKKKYETKQVTVGQNYGKLSIPEREGYIFKGWNGKNLLNYNNLTNIAKGSNYYSDISVDGKGYISDLSPTKDHRGWGYKYANWQIPLKAGNYSIKLDFKEHTTVGDSGLVVYDSDNNIVMQRKVIQEIDSVVSNFNIDSDKNIGIFIKSYDGVYKIQLEEGDKVTEWEPYYIESDTKVVQDKNHTLKAIWDYLPNEYQKVEYIESTGTQYIDTGVYMDSNKLVKIKFKYTEPQVQSIVIGAYDGSTNCNILSTWDSKFGVFSNGIKFFKDVDTEIHTYNWNGSSNNALLDDSNISNILAQNKCNNTWGIFGGNYTGVSSYPAINLPSKVRLFDMKIYDNSNLIRNYIPCYKKSDNTIGLYETVEGKFYTNKGTGTFNKGNNI